MNNYHDLMKEATKSYGLDVARDEYSGDASEYFVWNFSNISGSEYADDEEIASEVELQLHGYFQKKKSPEKILPVIKEKLVNLGFSNPRMSALYESDTQMRHLIWEMTYTERKDD